MLARRSPPWFSLLRKKPPTVAHDLGKRSSGPRPRPGRAATGGLRVLGGRSRPADPTPGMDAIDLRWSPCRWANRYLDRGSPTPPPGFGRSRRQGSGEVAIRPFLFDDHVVTRRATRARWSRPEARFQATSRFGGIG